MGLKGTISRVCLTLLLGLMQSPLTVQPAAAQVVPAGRLERVTHGIPAYTIGHVPVYIAKSKGYFREAGLEVAILNLKAELGIKAALAGSLDYAGSGSSPVEAAVRGVKIRVLMDISDRPLMDLITQPQIRSFQDLKGKVLAVSSFGVLSDTMARDILRLHQVEPDRDITFIAVGPSGLRMAALKARSVDATLLSIPHTFIAQAEGFRRLATAMDFIRTTQSGVSTSLKKISDHPGQIHRFLKASLKGLLFLRQRREGALPLLMAFLEVKDRGMAERIYDYSFKSFTEDGTISTALATEMIEQAKRAARITRPIPLQEVFDFSYLEKAKAELRGEGWQPQ